jgi:hypothetical protein
MSVAPILPTTAQSALTADHPREGDDHQPQHPVHAAREDQVLATLGHVRLQDPDAAQRLGEPAGDARELDAALAIDRRSLANANATPTPIPTRRRA